MEHSVRVRVLCGSRGRLDGIDLVYLFLDASHFKYRASAAAEPVLAAWASTPYGKPVSVRLDAAAVECGDVWAGFRPASASAAWRGAAGHVRRGGRADRRRRELHAPARCASPVFGDGNRDDLRL
jgi:hypothetical protein